MALVDDFKTRFPEFSASNVDSVFPVLESSYPSYFGGNILNFEEETMQLLAHLFVVETVINQSMGGVVEEDAADYDAFFKTSKYGQRFLSLIRHNHGAKSV